MPSKQRDNSPKKRRSQMDVTLIADTAKFCGSLTFKGQLEIQGCVEGKIESVIEETDAKAKVKPCKVAVREHGLVTGDIVAPMVLIYGEIIGNIYCEHIELAGSAVVHGDIHYISMEVHPGAKTKGALHYCDADSDTHPFTLAKK